MCKFIWFFKYNIFPSSTKFYHFLPIFILPFKIFTNFYHLPPIFIFFYRFLTLFILLLQTFKLPSFDSCQTWPLLSNFFIFLANFCHIFPPSTNFHYPLSNFTNFYTLLIPFSSFTLLFVDQKMVVFIFLSFDKHQPNHPVGCHVTGIILSFFFFFLHALCCLCLLHEAISLTGIIVSG